MNLNQYGLIGHIIVVKKSGNKTLVGIKGKVVDETKNMVILDSGKRLVKNQVEIEIIKKETK